MVIRFSPVMSLHSVGFLVVVTERLLKYAVNEFRFLLFTKLKAILAYLTVCAL